jgi:hypothetical protein
MVPWDSTSKLKASLDKLEGVTTRACTPHKPMRVHFMGLEWCYCCGAVKVDGEWMLPQRVKP